MEATNDEVKQVEEILRTEMENAVNISVPLKVDMNSGKTWYDTK